MSSKTADTSGNGADFRQLELNSAAPQPTGQAPSITGLSDGVPYCILPQDEFAPDHMRAEQISSILELASSTLSAMKGLGLNEVSAQRICNLLLPSTDAIAVAITDAQVILGYAGQDKDLNPIGGPIRTVVTHHVLEDGLMRVVRSSEEIGFPVERFIINAAIITPLVQGGCPIGTLKFYYPNAQSITETQLSIAEGFSELLSTQLDAAALEDERKAAARLELKMLQSQINPHFLFNVVNTIASFVRTDPDQARDLLREFATFYRSTLEEASDLIPLSREIEQTMRYLKLEVARFGDDRLQFSEKVPEQLQSCPVPAFIVQPLVENAVKHGMPSEGTLHITMEATSVSNDLILRVIDDGVGMTDEQRSQAVAAVSGDAVRAQGEGLGFALRNIRERITSYYGQHSHMRVDSAKGEGTVVELYLYEGLKA